MDVEDAPPQLEASPQRDPSEDPLSGQDAPNWTHILLLRQRRDEAAKAVQDIERLQGKLEKLRKRTEREESSESPSDTPPRRRKEHKLVPSRDIPETRQVAYIQLKRAVGGCLQRYDCTDKQRLSILYHHAELLKGKYNKE